MYKFTATAKLIAPLALSFYLILAAVFLARGAHTAAELQTIDPDVPIHWTYIGGHTAHVIVIDPLNAENIYVGGYNPDPMIYSRDYGNTWITTTQGIYPEGSVLALAIDPINPNYLYAGLVYGTIYRSVDQAQSWEVISGGIADDLPIGTLFVHPITPTLVFAGTDAGIPTIYRSIDRGDSWDVIPLTGPNNRKVAQIFSHPTIPERIYAVVQDEGVFLSEDMGETWDNTGIMADGLVIDPTNPDVMYRLDCYVYRSEDGGNQWEQLDAPRPCAQGLHMDPQNSQYLYLTSQYFTPIRSLDGGQSWHFMHGIGSDPTPDSYSFAMDPFDSTRLYVSGLYRSAYLDESANLPVIVR